MSNREDFLCSQCEEKIERDKFYYIFRLCVATDKEQYEIGFKKILYELSEFLMIKGCHLSASEIIFLRPDVVKEFLQSKYIGEEILLWYFNEFPICFDCYEEYKELVPLI